MREGARTWFLLPANAADAWLLSDASAPIRVSSNIDGRMLGVDIAELAIHSDGERRVVSLDDARLVEGFHEPERLADGSLHRWTNGRARLAAALWSRSSGDVVLELRILGAVPRWVAPAVRGTVDAAHAIDSAA